MTAKRPDPFELVIFDCDGVLADSEPVANVVFSEMLNELGLAVTLEDMYRDFMGRSLSTCMQTVRSRFGRPPPPNFAGELKQHTHEAFLTSLSPVCGVVGALDQIRIPYRVVPSGDHEKMRLTLGLTGLLERFDGNLFSVTQVDRGKPRPDVFLYAAKRMGAIPARTTVVEDTEIGVQAGVAEGLTVFAYAGLSNPEKLSQAGGIVFKKMERLPEMSGSGKPLAC